MDVLMAQASYALTVYGVSCFELLQYGIPTVVFSPYGDKDRAELERLKEQGVAVVAVDEYLAVTALRELMSDPVVSEGISRRAARKIDGKGALRLAEKVRALVS
jgi:spore coat polysaccharide biosynthesis predicted glycosyltransferase SpsG